MSTTDRTAARYRVKAFRSEGGFRSKYTATLQRLLLIGEPVGDAPMVVEIEGGTMPEAFRTGGEFEITIRKVSEA